MEDGLASGFTVKLGQHNPRGFEGLFDRCCNFLHRSHGVPKNNGICMEDVFGGVLGNH